MNHDTMEKRSRLRKQQYNVATIATMATTSKMGELKLPILSDIKSQEASHNTTSHKPQQRRDTDSISHGPQASSTMEGKQQQPVAARADADGVDIFKFEIAVVSVEKVLT